MRVDILRKVEALIQAEPRKINMSDWYRKWDTAQQYTEVHMLPDHDGWFPPCGTTGCIAGWAVYLEGKLPTEHQPIVTFSEEMELVAPAVLELTKEEAERLFWVGHWPKEHARAYYYARTPQERADAVVARIEYFILTKGTDVFPVDVQGNYTPEKVVEVELDPELVEV